MDNLIMRKDDTEDRIEALQSELIALKKTLDSPRKDPKAWEKLDKLGKDIAKAWKVPESSWELISESRR